MNSLEDKKERQAALGVIGSKVSKTSEVLNEEGPVSGRRGRSVQSAHGLDAQSALASDKTAMFRVVISKESNEALESALSRCAEGFDAGEFTKSDIANYIFQNVGKFFQDSDVKNLRAAHFDEKKMLGSILRTDADLPEELRKAIRAHYGVDDKEKKKSSKKADSLPSVA